MGVGVRKFNRHIKSLMHFDYPYFAEPGDGMRDEIGVLTWTNNGNAKFVGTEIPVAQNVAGTPKFGYRCLQTAAGSDYIEAPITNNYINIKSSKSYEIEFFIRKTNAAAGNIVNLLDDNDTSIFTISTDANNKIVLTCSAMSIAATSSSAVTLNTWDHVRVRINQGTAYIFINGVSGYSGSCSLEVSGASKIRLGGFIGQLDEFIIRDAVSNDNVPAVPYKGYIDTYGIGGNGKQGALNLTSGSSRINTVQEVTFQDSSTVKMDSLPTGEFLGIHGTYQVGDEVLIIKNQTSATKPDTIESGLYCLRRIKDISGTTITLDSPVTEFTFDKTVGTTKYTIKMHLVPNYSSVTIGSSATVTCRNTDDGSGGLVIFRSQGNVNIQGKILTSGLGMTRRDYFQMTHNHLPERFITNGGGGVIILSEGTVTAGDNARIGASWSGAGKAGIGYAANVTNRQGQHGGSGYGGGGGKGSTTGYKSGSGGVGGGGGSGINYHGYDVGVMQSTGGGISRGPTAGMTQGVNPIEHGDHARGGGALCNSDTSGGIAKQPSGACVMIICKTLQVSMNAISTGGAGGFYSGGYGQPGSGTGMCYLAYEEAI